MPQYQLTGAGLYSPTVAQVDPTHKALRTSLRPKEAGVFGSYALAAQSGVMAAGLAAQSPIFEFRWSSQSVLAIVTKLGISAVNDGTAFAVTNTSCIFDVIRATAFTATDATGSINIVISGKSNAKATRFAPSQIQQTTTTNIVCSNTATLSGGAKTLDGSPLNVHAGPGLTAGSTIVQLARLVDPLEAAKAPVELALNEGLVVRATVAATGTWRFVVDIEWDEVDPARYF